VCSCVCTVPRIRPKVWYPTSLLSLPTGIKILSLGAVLAISEIDEDIPGEIDRQRGRERRRGGKKGGRKLQREGEEGREREGIEREKREKEREMVGENEIAIEKE
jgi:hypothetical protein